jgi:very-long-chain (3R)-3-hydroxyacyl-CoA dehydratase
LVALVGMLVQYYLVAYNCAQAVGWGSALVSVASSYITGNTAAWAAFGSSITFWQNLALLEVLHSLAGAVRAPWHSTLLQIASRVFVVALINWLSDLQTNSALYIIGFAWCITEVIRYSWYALSGMGKDIKGFTILRYSTFIPLYPIGVYGELSLVCAALPAITGPAGLAAQALPNQPEFVQYFLIPFTAFFGVSLEEVFKYVIPVLYFFGLPFLYTLLWTARSKTLKRYADAEKAKKE